MDEATRTAVTEDVKAQLEAFGQDYVSAFQRGTVQQVLDERQKAKEAPPAPAPSAAASSASPVAAAASEMLSDGLAAGKSMASGQGFPFGKSSISFDQSFSFGDALGNGLDKLRKRPEMVMEAVGDAAAAAVATAPAPVVEMKAGWVTKRGAKVKNWKSRFLVVRLDYSLEYFDSEETYKAGGKPKGVAILEGYDIVTDPNARKIAQKKKEAADEGREDAEVEYSKYEPLTLEAYHPERRRWLFKFETQEEFDSWARVFQSCAALSSSRTVTDPTTASAFDTAFENRKKTVRRDPDTKYSGTETEMLTSLLTDHVRLAHMGPTLSKVPGPAKLKKMARNKIMAVVRGMVSAAVTTQWTVMSKGIEASAPKVKEGLEKSIGPVEEAQDKASASLDAKTQPMLAPMKTNLLIPFAAAIAGPLAAEAFKAYVSSPAFEATIAEFKEQVLGGMGLSMAQAQLQTKTRESPTMSSSFEKLTKFSEGYGKLADQLPEPLRGPLEPLMGTLEPLANIPGWVNEVRTGVMELNDRVVYTFQEALGGNLLNFVSVLADVAKMYSSASPFCAAGHVAAFLVPLLSVIVKGLAMDQLTPLLEPIDQSIPGPVKTFISAQAILERNLSKFVEGIAKEAAFGAVKQLVTG